MTACTRTTIVFSVAATCVGLVLSGNAEDKKPCCSAAVAVNSVCLKCRPGATAEPFNGNDLEAWSFKRNPEKSKWGVGIPAMSTENPKLLTVGEGGGAMVNQVSGHRQSVDVYSKAKFGDCRIELEVMVPKGANSGIYVMGEYEIQVLDSYGKKKLGGGDMGAIYGAAPPKVNACRKPGEWQKYVIDFEAPRFDEGGKKTANAKFIRVELNGQVLHENVEMKRQTPAGVTGKEHPVGPIMFQGDHGPVAYRNIRITDTRK
jgi:hypothetical protein